MKIDRIEVDYNAAIGWYWVALKKKGNFLFLTSEQHTKATAISEARWLAKRLGCKLVLPEEGRK